MKHKSHTLISLLGAFTSKDTNSWGSLQSLQLSALPPGKTSHLEDCHKYYSCPYTKCTNIYINNNKYNIIHL